MAHILLTLSPSFLALFVPFPLRCPPRFAHLPTPHLPAAHLAPAFAAPDRWRRRRAPTIP
eukprot:9362012-Pyramimonas_sp.AAC.1